MDPRVIAFVLAGGEDYELAIAFDPGDLEEVTALADSKRRPITVIGEVGDGSGVRVTSSAGPIEPGPGFEHSF